MVYKKLIKFLFISESRLVLGFLFVFLANWINCSLAQNIPLLKSSRRFLKLLPFLINGYCVYQLISNQSCVDNSYIYLPTFWVELSWNSRIILDFFLFWNCKLQNHLKILWLNHHLSTYLALKGYYVHTKLCSWFRSILKTRKLLRIILELNSSQLST